MNHQDSYNDKQYRETEDRQGCGKTILISILSIILVVVAMFFMCSCNDNTLAPGKDTETQDIPGWHGFLYTQANAETYHLSHVIYDPKEDVIVLFDEIEFVCAYFRTGLVKFTSTAIGNYKIIVVVNGKLMFEAQTVSYEPLQDVFKIDDLSISRLDIKEFEFWQALEGNTFQQEEIKYYAQKFTNKRKVKLVLSKNIQNQGLL